MSDISLALGGAQAETAIGRTVREARHLIGWTQRELAARAGTSQATVCRVEAGRSAPADFGVVERILVVLGLRPHLVLDTTHLADRRRQFDGLHARMNGVGARRLEALGWLTATEVRLGDEVPRGWIDLLGFRPADRSLLVDETKTDIPDMGGLQRSVARYEREAWSAAALLGWRPARVVVMVTALDSRSVARRLADNRDLVTRAFPGNVGQLAAWLADPSEPPPVGWTLAGCDPAAPAADWLRATILGGRRTPPRYEDYADAARRILRGHRGGR